MSEAIIRVNGLSKRFGSVAALDGVSTDFFRGSITGLLGDNGAGKSTLLRHMIGLYLPDSGVCETFGVGPARLGPAELARIGYVHQEGKLPGWMSAAQLIRYVSAYYETWNRDIEERYISDFDIDLRARVGSMSPGQRQKLAILLAIGFEPELLILDEPASALDPVARGRFLNLILDMIQDAGRTIIISSHILSDVEKVIDHAMVMKKGAVLRDCSFDELREEFVRFSITSGTGAVPEVLPFDNIVREKRDSAEAVLTVRGCSIDQIRQQASSINCDVEFRPLSLDEIYELVVEGFGEKEAV